MEWQFIVALVLAIPIILFPAAFVWYLNIGGIFTAIKEAFQQTSLEGEIVMTLTLSNACPVSR